MMDAPAVFWDTCVFGAHLYDEREQYGEHVDHIRQYLREAGEGRWRIVTSSIVIAEIAFSKVKRGAPGKLEDLINDLFSTCLIIEPNPDIMILAGKLRDIPYRKGKSEKRVLSVPDAVMLATAIHSVEYVGSLRQFHSFDKGGRKGSIPIVGYEEWLESIPKGKQEIAKMVCDLDRAYPIHPTPELVLDD